MIINRDSAVCTHNPFKNIYSSKLSVFLQARWQVNCAWVSFWGY